MSENPQLQVVWVQDPGDVSVWKRPVKRVARAVVMAARANAHDSAASVDRKQILELDRGQCSAHEQERDLLH